MSTDPETACIVRLGVPGKFCYQVIEGRESFPICFVSEENRRVYAAWKGCILATCTDDDLFIKCNNRGAKEEEKHDDWKKFLHLQNGIHKNLKKLLKMQHKSN